MQKNSSFSGYLNAWGDIGRGIASAFTENIAAPVANYVSPPPTPDTQKRIDAANIEANRKIHRQMGNDILTAGAGGLGAGILLTRLHQILSQINKPDEKYTKFSPGAHPVDEDEKIASNWGDDIAEGLGSTLLSPVAPAELPKGSDSVPWSDGQKAIRVPAVLATAGLSLLAGHQLMNSLYAKKKKEELNDTVRDAKKEYERALMGKRGADALDRAFEKASADTWADWLTGTAANVVKSPFQLVNMVPGLREAYWTGLLGTGVAAGKMTYDWTRERSRDKAIERARRARARMAGTAPVYVDPEQLVAVKKLIEK